MARRTPNEINAGSMADIAFLLLIFFLVTTTMEVDAGIRRQMPVKNRDQIDDNIIVHQRDVLNIKTNALDQLYVEDELTKLEDLEQIVRDFYTVNLKGEKDLSMPRYDQVSTNQCQSKIAELESLQDKNPNDQWLKKELHTWRNKLSLCQNHGGAFAEIAPLAMIRIENQSKTSFGLYIAIQNTLKKVVNELRRKRCRTYFKRDYNSLDSHLPEDAEIIEKIRILVPERIIDARIER